MKLESQQICSGDSERKTMCVIHNTNLVLVEAELVVVETRRLQQIQPLTDRIGI